MWATRSAPQSFSACYGPAVTIHLYSESRQDERKESSVVPHIDFISEVIPYSYF